MTILVTRNPFFLVSEGTLVFSVEEQFRDTFSVTPSGDLVTVSGLDRERDSFYAFKVTVSDSFGDAGGLSSTCVVEVTVADVNDEPPAFDRPRIFASVPENAPAGTPFAKVSARDADAGRNAEVSYLLEDSYGERFSVGRVDGMVRSEAALDREETGRYTLAVVASDNGRPRLSSRVEIEVTVENDDDNAPAFNPKFYT